MCHLSFDKRKFKRIIPETNKAPSAIKVNKFNVVLFEYIFKKVITKVTIEKI